MNSSTIPLDIKNLHVVGGPPFNVEDEFRKFLQKGNKKPIRRSKRKETRYINSAVYAISEVDDTIMPRTLISQKQSAPQEQSTEPMESYNDESVSTDPVIEILKPRRSYERIVTNIDAKVAPDTETPLKPASLSTIPTRRGSSLDSCDFDELDECGNQATIELRKQRYGEWLKHKEERRLLMLQVEKQKHMHSEEVKKINELKMTAMRKENFQKWLQKKDGAREREQELLMLQKKRERMEQAKREEHAKEVEMCLRQWKLKKKEEAKKQKEAERAAEERNATLTKVSRKESKKAFRRWLAGSSTRLPPTVGFEVPQVGFVNPIPWKPVGERPTECE